MMNPSRLSKYYYRRFQRLKGSPKTLAAGFAIGVFVGMTPTMPFHTIIIIIATISSRTSTLAAILSSWLVCNPITTVPIYYFSLTVGNAITPYHLNWEKIKVTLDVLESSGSFSEAISTIFSLGFEAVAVLVAGGTVLGFIPAIVSYYLALRFFTLIKQKKIKKHILY